MDIEVWKEHTIKTMQYHFDHNEPGMAFRAYVIAMRELILDQRHRRIIRALKKWERDVDAFNAMADMKNDLRQL